MNGYELSKNWYAFKFENLDSVKHIHSDMYFYIIDLWNRLGQKKEFGLPTQMTMELLGIGSYNTYKKTLSDLIDFGFIVLVKDSKNQHNSKIVALSFFDKALDKALDKATAKASDKPTDKAPDKATDTIVEQENKRTKELRNKENIKKEDFLISENLETPIVEPKKEKEKNSAKKEKDLPFNPKDALLELGIDEIVIRDYLQNRKAKKSPLTETAFNAIVNECNKNNYSISDAIKLSAEKNWIGFKYEWTLNLQKNNGTTQQPNRGFTTNSIRTTLGANAQIDGSKYGIPTNDPRDRRYKPN